MKVQFSQSIDFNQMLVFSVFGHLLLLTAVLFLPKPRLLEKVVVPAFMVNLVSEPTGFKSAVAKRSESPARVKKPKAKRPDKRSQALKKTKVSKSKIVKKVPAAKTHSSKAVLEKLNDLKAKMALATPPGKKIAEELDQLARLEKPKHKPLATKPIKKKPLNEETFRELETLKNKKVNKIKKMVPVPLQKDILEDFEELKVEESLPKPSPEKKQPEKPQSSKMDLLKELGMLDISPVPKTEIEESGPHESVEKGSESFNPIMEKFDSLFVESETIRIEISSAQLDSSHFQSGLRSFPKSLQATTESGTGESYVFAKKEGIPGADSQAVYASRIKKTIFENWRAPLGEEHNEETVVSFSIFHQGNIDNPFVKKSSGVKALDNRAIRAVLDSAPFPKFPKELKMSNLRMSIHFKYVLKDK